MTEAASHEARLVESFVPPPLRRSLSETGSTAPGAITALLWLDIVGSTGIAARLVQSGPVGAEQFAALLKQHFDRLLDTLAAHGGEPLMFAGDALLAGWHCTAADPREAVQRAAACGQAILAAPGAALPDGEALRLHVAVALGPTRTAEIGTGRHALYVTIGDGLADLQAIAVTRAPGQVLLSAAARAALGAAAEAVQAGTDAAILIDLHGAPPPVRLSIPPLAAAAVERLQVHVPLPIASRLERRLLEWAAELRRVTVVFAGFLGLDHAGADVLHNLEQVAAIAGPVVQRHGGYIHQLRVDESGANLLIYFGIPPIAHHDDPARAVRCAIDLRDALRGRGQRGSFGVATGRVVCGLVGNDIFRAFAIYGEPVNLAARLQRVRLGMIQCDEATVRSARESVAFAPVGQSQLRGLGSTVAVWSPQRQDRADAPLPMHGREYELGLLLDALRESEAGPARLVLIEAESGMGKSRLLAELQQRAAAAGATVLAGFADQIEQRVPFRIWRGVFARLLGLDAAAAEPLRRSTVLDALGPELAPRAALLNAVLSIDLPETAQTRALAPLQRIPLLQALLLALLRREAAAQPLLITIDDAQWADGESWSFAEAVAREVSGLCLVMGMQPLDDDSRLQALTASGARRLRLGELSAAEQDALALTRLGAERMAPDLSALLRARARGHPFFCLELAQALHDEGLVEVIDGTCRIARHIDAASLPLPETVQGTMTRRIDHMAPDSQLTLKVASAAGLRFPSQLVLEVHPTSRAAPAVVAGHLTLHHRMGLLAPDLVDDRDGYAFHHGIMRDVAYGLMLYGQRHQLHRDIAAWYERAFALDRSHIYPVLAHHLEAAGEHAQASGYLRLEAERLFGLGLVRQAVECGLHGARLLGAPLPSSGPALQQALGQELEQIATRLGDRRPEELASIPPLADASAAQLIGLLLTVAPFAYQGEQRLFALLACTCLRLTLQHGNGPWAADVYGMYSVVFGAMSGDRTTAVQWSRLSLALQHGQLGAGFARCAFIHAWFHNHWVASLDRGIALAMDGAMAGLNDGEIIYGCFNLSAFVVLLAAAGRPLAEVMAAARGHIVRNGNRVLNARYHLVLELQYAKALAGATSGLLALGDAEYDAVQDISSILDSSLAEQVGYYFVTMTKLHVQGGDWAGALQWADKARPMLPFFQGQTAEFELTQYRGLAALASAALGAGGDRHNLIEDGWDCTEQLRGWEAQNPDLFRHKADMLDGLLQAAGGHPKDASWLLRRSAEGAARGGFLQDAGLAQEYLARCLRVLGDTAGADAAARAAGAWFAAWGAGAKVAVISREFDLG